MDKKKSWQTTVNVHFRLSMVQLDDEWVFFVQCKRGNHVVTNFERRLWDVEEDPTGAEAAKLFQNMRGKSLQLHLAKLIENMETEVRGRENI